MVFLIWLATMFNSMMSMAMLNATQFEAQDVASQHDNEMFVARTKQTKCVKLLYLLIIAVLELIFFSCCKMCKVNKSTSERSRKITLYEPITSLFREQSEKRLIYSPRIRSYIYQALWLLTVCRLCCRIIRCFECSRGRLWNTHEAFLPMAWEWICNSYTEIDINNSPICVIRALLSGKN